MSLFFSELLGRHHCRPAREAKCWLESRHGLHSEQCMWDVSRWVRSRLNMNETVDEQVRECVGVGVRVLCEEVRY
jgi:hypothetical protein